MRSHRSAANVPAVLSRSAPVQARRAGAGMDQGSGGGGEKILLRWSRNSKSQRVQLRNINSMTELDSINEKFRIYN